MLMLHCEFYTRDLTLPEFTAAKYLFLIHHYSDVIMTWIASQITSLTIVCSIVYSDADQRKHQSSASLAFVRGIHRGPVNSPHKWPVTRKMFPFGDVIMISETIYILSNKHCCVLFMSYPYTKFCNYNDTYMHVNIQISSVYSIRGRSQPGVRYINV